MKSLGIKENIKLLREKYKLSQKDLALIAGVTDKAVSTWESGAKEPRMGAIQKIADHFGLKKSNLIEDNGLTEKQGYYIDPEAAKMAQELYENPGMRILFDAAKNVSPEDLKVAAELISRMKKKEEYEE
uniref:Repressor protein CI n=1 Tax=Podoviridae sp. ctW0z17 TaxID=2825254 RepID=A0A8S5UXR0_9CAUD|nr:MAG TPA: Repressor protein CI [Podoviridae sp. ctW0z17]DAP60210.1 MAG TPA: Repressor protein CI [Caudoviricetes sp.]